MSVSIMREPLRDYLATNMPGTYWTAARKTITGEIIKDGYSKGVFMHFALHDDHLSLQSTGKQSLQIYYYQADLLDRLLAEARTRYQRVLAHVNRAELIADIYVSINQKNLQYLATHYDIEPDNGGNYDYSDIINTLMAEKVKHLKRCRQSRSPSLVTQSH